MKTYVLAAAVAAAAIAPGTASALDWRSPNPDVEARQKSEQLHVSAGSAMARAQRYEAGAVPARQYHHAPVWANPYPDMRERVLRGYDY